MATTYIITSLAIFLTVSDICYARFLRMQSQALVGEVEGVSLLSGSSPRAERNNMVFQDAVQLVQTSFSSCSPAVCFALDGSSALTPAQFEIQKDFVQLAAATLGGLSGAKFAAVQYAGSVANPIPISPLVDAATQGVDFLLDVEATAQAGSNPTFVEGAIQYCIDEFEDDPSSAEKILILGDGSTNLGSDNAVSLAQSWDNLGTDNKLCAGIVGHGNKEFFVELVGGVNTDVRRPANWNLLINDIFAFINGICGTSASPTFTAQGPVAVAF
eukprot:GFKZ01011084.1.p1 GENE.GFKZ01011084.1~~GFKZ01011084.1.p1  ORF type:complete len:272 (+),score=34.72 GFKZ01011084.1:211-1026(+)